MTDLRMFDATYFTASPLYSALCPVVAGDEVLLDIAGHARPGQRPEYLFFGAVQHLLLTGADHDLAGFYRSVVGAAAHPPAGAGPALRAFGRRFRADLTDIVRTRLVQTNHVRRAVGLRAALSAIAPDVEGPVDLVEIGASAGLLLNSHRYGYRLHRGVETTSFGDPSAPVQLACELRGQLPAPDLDVSPAIASATGVDLHPIDPADPDNRAWLTALVFPEDDEQRRLLAAALDVAVEHPVHLVAGDAVGVLPGLEFDAGARVAFHCATRIHVAAERLAAFDAAIDALGDDVPLWRVAIEYPPEPAGGGPGIGLTVTAPDGARRLVAVVDGHLRWLEPRSD